MSRKNPNYPLRQSAAVVLLGLGGAALPKAVETVADVFPESSSSSHTAFPVEGKEGSVPDQNTIHITVTEEGTGVDRLTVKLAENKADAATLHDQIEAQTDDMGGLQLGQDVVVDPELVKPEYRPDGQ